MSEVLAQGPYVAAGVGFRLVTLRTHGTELTTEPPRFTRCPGALLSIAGVQMADCSNSNAEGTGSSLSC